MQSQLGEVKPDRSNRKLLELCPLGLALCRTDGSFLEVNPAFATIIGCTVAETLNLNYWEILQTDCAGREKYLEIPAKNTCTGSCEAAYKHKNNHLVPVRVSERAIETEGEWAICLSAENFFNGNNENSQSLESAPAHCDSDLEKLLANQTAELAKNQELLPQKIAELEQAKSQLQLQNQILEQIREAVICTDACGSIISWNKAAQRLYGYEESEVIGQHIGLVHPPQQRELLSRLVAKKLEETGECELEIMMQRKSGEEFESQLSLSLLKDVRGEIIGSVGCIRDISDRKALEQELENRQALFDAFLQDAPAGLCIFDSQLRYVQINQFLADINCLTPAEHIGKTIREILPELAPMVEPLYEQIFRTKEPLINIEMSAENLRKPGVVRHLTGSYFPLLDKDGEAIGIGAVVIDISDRKLAESALRQSEARFQKMAANVPGMIYQYLLRPDGSNEFIYVSSGCWELYELNPEKVQKNSDLMWSAVHPEDLKPLLESVALSGETLKPWIYEGRIVTRSGKLKWIRGIARPEVQPGGDILWEGVTIDISDRKLAEIALSESKIALQQAYQELEKRVLQRTEALQTSQKMLWLVINNIPQFIAWKDRDLVYLGGNKNFAKVAGFNHPSEIAGLTDYDMPWKPEETESFRACDRRIMATNTPEYHIIEPQLQADGTQRWLDTNKIPLHDNNGNVVGILCTFEDITERLSLEAKVQASEELFRKIFEDAPIAIYLANLDDNTLMRVNKTYCEMLGYTIAELLAKTFIELGHPDDSPKNIQVADSLERGEITHYQIELRQITATGKIVWVNVTATLIRDGEGKPIYNLGMIENITNRKISAAALQLSLIHI